MRIDDHKQREIAQRRAAAEHNDRLRTDEVRRRLRREMKQTKGKQRARREEA